MWKWTAALVLIWGLAACGGSPCANKCEEIREDLLKNFGYSEQQIDCAHPKWDEADTCLACETLLQTDYDVSPEGEDFCDGF